MIRSRANSMSKSRPVPATPRRFRPRLDVLEVREVLSTLVVTSPADSGPGTLRDAVASAASGDTITFAPSLVGQTITITSGLIPDVGKDLAIRGPGADKLAISGGGTSDLLGFFKGQAPGAPSIDAAVSGLTLRDGKSSTGSGGAIASFGANLTLDGDVFANNTASFQGGAVDAEGPFGANTVTITNTRFVGNSAGSLGGAYQSFGLTVNIADSVFDHNTAPGLAGGAVIGASATTITRSTFLNNSGGGVYHTGSSSVGVLPLTVDSSVFVGNTTSGFGGAIASGGGTTVTRSTFVKNASVNSSFAQGGAIQVADGVTIDACVFAGNAANGGQAGVGGAVFIQDGQANAVTHSLFAGNLATGPGANGGAIAQQSFAFTFQSPRFTLDGDVFDGNRAVATTTLFQAAAIGGAVDIENNPGIVTVANTVFAGNAAVGSDSATGSGGPAFGGAMVATGGFGAGGPPSLTITNTSFAHNTAQGGSGAQGGGVTFGGALWGLFGYPSVTINGGSFVDNAALAGAGGFVPGLGGAITTFGAAVNIDGTSFVHNTAHGSDGAPGLDGGQGNGGAIYGVTGTVSNATFVGNTAVGGRGGAAIGSGVGGRGGAGQGGAIFTDGLTVANSQFNHNAAQGGAGGPGGATGAGGAGGDGVGGGIFYDGFAGPLVVTDSLFVQNEAIGGPGGSGATSGASGRGLGGGIAILGGTATIKRTKFVKNKASTSGNDVYGPYSS